MSKEQTPIEQILRTTLVIDNQKGIKYGVEKLEAHFNAKVLEALEREVPEAFRQGRIEESNRMEIPDYKKIRSTKYYETEVKPRYVK